jgi:hypothetical protein
MRCDVICCDTRSAAKERGELTPPPAEHTRVHNPPPTVGEEGGTEARVRRVKIYVWAGSMYVILLTSFTRISSSARTMAVFIMLAPTDGVIVKNKSLQHASSVGHRTGLYVYSSWGFVVGLIFGVERMHVDYVD